MGEGVLAFGKASRWGCMMNTVRLVYCVKTDEGVVEYPGDFNARQLAVLLNSDMADRLPAPKHWYGWWEAREGD